MRSGDIEDILRELAALREQIAILSEAGHGADAEKIPDLCNPLPPYARGTGAAVAFRPIPFEASRRAH
jgi:hypothetical protein